ncbi:alternative oxidase, mitochondrial-like [Planoprotostelium fungivorum]|uniref:Alternative oxidase, mitochondrial-like n=1 Tax=Planoprotostelium fungivorum TaxID=1890364 RepID=A0A2P6P058_9EUKA|nr:alternative oxidase, mitochondrial-like [Planoprotostelium fungivorum]
MMLLRATPFRPPIGLNRCVSIPRNVMLQKRAYSEAVFKGKDAGTKEDKARVQEALSKKTEDIREHAKGFTDAATQENTPHSVASVDFGENYNLPHPLWRNEYIWRVKVTHKPTEGLSDRLALLTIKAIRFNFDWMSGWSTGKVTTDKALNRICFLESVAGVPGSVAAILRHLSSLRRMKRDHGWIHTLLEEAENERMHLLTYLKLKDPGLFFRSCVWLTQGIFFNFFFAAYLVNPTFCHRLVGYLEEEAVSTYTHILHELLQIDHGELKNWATLPAPDIAIDYWKMDPASTMRDVVAVTRADEAHHREVNHAFANLNPSDSNPYKPGH